MRVSGPRWRSGATDPHTRDKYLSRRRWRRRSSNRGGAPVSLGSLWRVALLIIVGLSVAGCFAPDFTYVADSSDNAYFKVPPSWHEVSPSSLEAVQGQSGSQGTYLWSRAYDDSATPSGKHVFSAAPSTVGYASVLGLSSPPPHA